MGESSTAESRGLRSPGGSVPPPPGSHASALISPAPRARHCARPAARSAAIAWLLFATVLWGASFPLSKALVLAQAQLAPRADSWDLTALDLVVRFGLAGLLVATAARRTFPRELTRRELSQGLGLGLFAAIGMLFQLDGLNYTAASTSSFLTSCYCVIIPAAVALRRRRLPPVQVTAGCGLATIGIAVLADLDWHTLRLGRGEAETIIASLFFAAQIFWLERPLYARNRTTHATAMMFATLALGAATVILCHTRQPARLLHAAAGSAQVAGCLLVLTIFCTLITFSLMNHWQRHLEASQAGLIYCAEPLWTSLCALCLPAWLAAYLGVAYTNERFTPGLLIGGGLITAANVCIQAGRKQPAL